MTTLLDVPSLQLLLGVICLGTTVVTLAQLQSRRQRGAGWWAAALVACTLGWWWWGPLAAGLPLARTLGAICMLLVPIGVALALFALARQPAPQRLMLVVVAAVLAASLIWSGSWRPLTLSFSLGCAVLFVLAAWPLLRPLADIPAGLRWLVAASLLVAAAGLTVRACVITLDPYAVAEPGAAAGEFGPSLALLANLAGIVVANLGYTLMLRARAQADFIRQARLDPLTGVLNSAGLQERMTALAASPEQVGQSVALLIVDVRDLSGINARAGHLASDHLLRELAKRLRQTVPRAAIGRVADDKFLVVMAGADEAAEALIQSLQAAARADRIEHELAFGLATGTLGEHDPLRLAVQAENQLAVRKRRQPSTGGKPEPRAEP